MDGKENTPGELEFGGVVRSDSALKFVDLAITWPDGKTEALEVETEDTQRALGNIQKNILIGFDVISVLTPNHKTKEAIKKQMLKEIEEVDHDRICFPAISFYDK